MMPTEASTRSRIGRLLAVLAAASLLCWPAVYNRYPFIFPDTATYLRDGHRVAAALAGTLHELLRWRRAPVYSLVLLPLHRNRTLWPIVVLNALAVSYTVWLVVRSIVTRRPVLSFLVIISALVLLTGLPWDCCWIMPDIFGPVAYVGLFLLVFAAPALSGSEKLIVSVLVCWATLAHMTHLLLMALLCALLLALSLLRFRILPVSLRAAGRAWILLGIAISVQLAVNARLYDQLGLTATPRPPFLMARLIGDGPAFQVLQQRCGHDIDWRLCQFLPVLAVHPEHFLWDPDGVLANSSPAQIAELDHEESPLLSLTLRQYPLQQLRRSAANFWHQLTSFNLEDFSDSADTDTGIETAIPGAAGAYRHSRQYTNSMPTELFSAIQEWTVCLAGLVVLASLLSLRARLGPRLLGLSAIIVVVLVANAALTGVISDVDPRYQVRVIWLLPLLAGLCLLRWAELKAPGPLTASTTEVPSFTSRSTG